MILLVSAVYIFMCFLFLYTPGRYLFQKLRLFKLTKEEMFSDASCEEFLSWKKLERAALIIYIVTGILLIIGVIIGLIIGVLLQIYRLHGDLDVYFQLEKLGSDLNTVIFGFGVPMLFVGAFFEGTAKRFGEKVGIDWPGRVEEVNNISPAPDLTEEMFKGMPTFAPKKEDLKIIDIPIQDKTYILAIDPGLSKCGLAVLDSDGWVTARAWCKRDRLEHFMKEFVDQYKPSKIAVGDGTGSAGIVKLAENQFPGKVNIVKEKGTTYEARELFISESSQRGFSMLLIKKLRGNPVDLNAWVAVVIGRRFIGVK
jgi:RNase H-fold protein (predicted Holliday junction resolvase)